MKKVLYKKDSVGKIRILELEVNGAVITESSGLLDGKRVTKTKTIKEGKNIGRANETTPAEQAVAETISKWNHKKDKGYFDTIKEAEGGDVYLPMLAHVFSKRKHDITYPAYAQPKLDGVRCLVKKVSDTEIHFMSRGGKNYETLQQHPMKDELLGVLNVGDIRDGEIYKHGWSLQKITSAVKKYKPITLDLEYWIYDIPNDKTFDERFIKVEKSDKLTYLETHEIASEEDVYAWHNDFVKQGFEGVIIRNREGLYKFGSRSADLQKHKEFIDAEFEIIGWEVEEQTINGEEYKCIMYECKTKEGATFKCRPRGSLKSRGELLKVASNLIGKKLTVRYQALTDDTQGDGKKVPQFPVGICIRDYEQ